MRKATGVIDVGLAVRLSPPRVPSDVVSRPRLFDRLTRVTSQDRATLVAGGAGFGKSVLLSSWLSQQGAFNRIAWLTLDRVDADVPRLNGDLLAALQGPFRADRPEAAASLLRLLPPPLLLDSQRFVDALLAALAHIDEPLLLVLDDVHEVVDSTEAMTVLDRLLRWGPPTLHVLMASRADPPLALQRLRLAGEVAVLRHRDLAFTPEESALLFEQSGVTLQLEEAAALHEATEGWPAGVRMAALSVKGAVDVTTFVRTFAARDRALSDYLTGEVLEALPQRLREFVLSATVDDDVCAQLVDMVTGGSDAEAVLAECERQNLFITVSRDDHDHRWYRWHPVFAAHMHRRRQFEDPTGALKAELLAAQWWLDHDPVRAIRHALAGQDVDFAESIMADRWLDLTLEGHGQAVLDLIALLPADSDLAAEYHLARSLVHLRSEDQEAPLLELKRAVAEAGRLPEAYRYRFEVRLAVLRLFIVTDRTSLTEAVRDGRAIMDELRSSDWVPDPSTAALAALGLGMGEARLQEDVAAAIRLLTSARDTARARGFTAIELVARAELCVPLIATGDLLSVEAEAQAVLDEAAELGWSNLGSLVVASSYLGWLAYWRGDVDDARRYMDQVIESMARAEWAMRILAHFFRGLSCVAEGDLEEARFEVAEARGLDATGNLPPFGESLVNCLEAECLLAEGSVDAALAVAMAPTSGPTYRVMRFTRAAALIRAGAPERALDELGELADDRRFPQIAVGWGVLHCLALAALGQQGQAHVALESALVAAAPAELLRPFLTQPDRLRPILSAHVDLGTTQPELLAHLIERMAEPVVRRARGWDEQLTPKELSVLRYLRTPMSNAEIAAEQYVSVNTVKTHTAKIYRKLGVANRREAVRKAVELGLFEAPSGGTTN